MRTKDAGAHAREKKEGERERQEPQEKLERVTVKLTEKSTRSQELEKTMENHLDWEGKRVDTLAVQSNPSSKALLKVNFCINHRVFDCCTLWKCLQFMFLGNILTIFATVEVLMSIIKKKKIYSSMAILVA